MQGLWIWYFVRLWPSKLFDKDYTISSVTRKKLSLQFNLLPWKASVSFFEVNLSAMNILLFPRRGGKAMF